MADFSKSETAKVVINLTTQRGLAVRTDFSSPTSLMALQREISAAQQDVLQFTSGNGVDHPMRRPDCADDL